MNQPAHPGGAANQQGAETAILGMALRQWSAQLIDPGDYQKWGGDGFNGHPCPTARQFANLRNFASFSLWPHVESAISACWPTYFSSALKDICTYWAAQWLCCWQCLVRTLSPPSASGCFVSMVFP